MMTDEEYCDAVERYMRIIWDDSVFPEKKLREKRTALIELYKFSTPVKKAANIIIDQIQEENVDPVVEAIIDDLFRKTAEQKKMLRKKRQRK